MRELIPAAADVGLLINPADPARAEFAAQDVEAATRASGLQDFQGQQRRRDRCELRRARADRVDALFVASDILFNLRRVQLTILAATHRIPATYPMRELPKRAA